MQGSIAGVQASKSGEPKQSFKAPPSEFKACKISDLKIQGCPISPRPHFRSSRSIRVRIRDVHQSQFKICKGSALKIRGDPSVQGPTRSSSSERIRIINQGRSISPRPYSQRSRSIRVLLVKSGVPHESKAPPSEFKIYKSSDLKIRGAHQSKAISSEFNMYKSFDSKSGALHHSKTPPSEFKIYKSSALKMRGASSLQRPFLGVQDF